jgi:hypothetical protein
MDEFDKAVEALRKAVANTFGTCSTDDAILLMQKLQEQDAGLYVLDYPTSEFVN